MLHSIEDAPVRRVAGPADHADDGAGHRDHRDLHLLAVQPDPGHPRGHARHRRVGAARGVRPRAVPPAAAVHPAPPGGRRRRPVRARRRVPAGAPPGARAHRAGRLDELAARPVRAAPEPACRERGGQGRRDPVARGPRRAHRARAGDRARGDRRVRRDAPLGPVPRAADDDLRAANRAPRRGGDHPRGRRARRGRAAAADRDDPLRAVRDAPSRRARHHRGHRRDRGRRVRGERPDERRRAGPDRARPDRGAARAGARRAPRGADRTGGSRARPARHGCPPAHRPATHPTRSVDRRARHARRARRRAAGGAAAGPATGTDPAEAVEPAPEPVDPMPETPPAAGAEGDDDATHRVPEVPRDEAGGTAAAAVADR